MCMFYVMYMCCNMCSCTFLYESKKWCIENLVALLVAIFCPNMLMVKTVNVAVGSIAHPV